MSESSKKLALKIDVDTNRGTREGVPRLVEALQRHNAGATFLFSLGPDHTGRAIKRVFRPGFMKKVGRTSVVSHYGLKTLMYGTLLPGPDIGRRCEDILRSVKAAGFEVGIHCWDHIRWQDGVAKADNLWTEAEMDKALQRFRDIFGEDAKVHGAAGWQMNRHALRLTQRRGFHYSSDGRGETPFLPVWQGEPVACVQLPTTLPTLDELIGVDGITEDNVVGHLLSITRDAPPTGHVYTLHAELEGMKLLPRFESLLQGWKGQGYELVAMENLLESLDKSAIPHHEVEMGTIPGRSGTLMVQRRKFVRA